MSDKSVVSLAVLYFIFYLLAGFVCYLFLVPLLPDGIWLSTALDSFLKSLLIAVVPSSALALCVYHSKHRNIGYCVSLLVFLFILACYIYALCREKDESGIMMAFLNSFMLPFSVLGILFPLISALMKNGKKNGR